MESAWPEPPNAKSADVRDGVEAFARATTKKHSNNGPQSFSVAGLFSRPNMDPQIRRWLIALVIAIILFAIGMAVSISHLI